ncbi:MAG: cation:H+ antiporter [Chloroflexi bacterium]|nr:MAG: cation:H+ antiporter [Chloroflexota bacterium]
MDLSLNLSLGGYIGLFAVAAAVVVGAAAFLAKSGDVIALRTPMGRLWAGSLLLAGATSLPELVTNVTAVRIDAPSLAAGNIFGANMLNMATLSAMALLLGGRYLFQSIVPQQVFVAFLAIAMTGAATAFTIVRLDVVTGISIAGPLLIFLYIVASWVLKKVSSGEGDAYQEEAGEGEHTLRWGVLVFAACAAAIFLAAPLLANAANGIAAESGLSQSFVGVLMVSIVTTLPEMTATAMALRMGAPDLALAGIYGSNAFNVMALGIADIAYPKGSLFAALDSSHMVAGLIACGLIIMGTAQILMLRKGARSALATQLSSGSIVAVYVLGLYLVFRLG